jgi:hypothetical protein
MNTLLWVAAAISCILLGLGVVALLVREVDRHEAEAELERRQREWRTTFGSPNEW